jgi:hypothetical protein
MIQLQKFDLNNRSDKNIKNSKNKLKFKIILQNSNIMPSMNSKYSISIKIRPYMIQDTIIDRKP